MVPPQRSQNSPEGLREGLFKGLQQLLPLFFLPRCRIEQQLPQLGKSGIVDIIVLGIRCLYQGNDLSQMFLFHPELLKRFQDGRLSLGVFFVQGPIDIRQGFIGMLQRKGPNVAVLKKLPL